MVKKLRFSILSLLMLICGAVMAQEVTPYKSLTFPDDNKQSNGTNVYTSNWTAKIGTDSWTISKFSNNNWAWGNIRCGRKSYTSVATIVNDAAFEKAVTKVVVDFKTMTATNKSKVNSIKLIVASDDKFSKDVQTITGDLNILTTDAADMEFVVSSPAENLFYKLEVNCKKSSNGFVEINSLKYYAAEGGSGTVSAPKFSAASTTFTDPFQVTITAAEGAAVYYTLDGTDPKTSDTKKTYNAGDVITITATTTLRAVAEKDNIYSDETTATYTFVVEAPTFDVASKKFSEPFDVTITAHEGATIYYTLNGENPTEESTRYEGAITILAETTLKAIAVIKGVLSDVTTATYTYRAPSDNDGSFAKPYTAEEVLNNASDWIGKMVWVKGKILGAVTSDGYKTLTENASSIVIGTEEYNIGISVPNSTTLREYINSNYQTLSGQEILVYGKLSNYYKRLGMGSGSIAFAGTEESPIATLKVKTEEGYATFVSKLPFFVPEGVECATVTEADGNGVLNFDYKYKKDSETYDVVPANYPVLVKADGKNTFNLVIASARKGTSNGTNLLKAGTDSEIAAEVGHYYYKLAYDNFDTKEGLGFYWGATDGGAFTVPTGSAYLDIESTGTTALKSFRFDNATTGISTPVVNEQGEAVKVAYTLDGRRVDAAHLTKGLYIVNGKKVIVK